MSKGPEQLKFEQAVGEKGSARSQSMDLLVAKQRWHQMAQVLHDSADDLELRAYSAPAVSDQTGAAMQDAFLKTAAAMRERAAKLDDGARVHGWGADVSLRRAGRVAGVVTTDVGHAGPAVRPIRVAAGGGSPVRGRPVARSSARRAARRSRRLRAA